MKHQLNGKLKNIMIFSAGTGKRRLRVDGRLKRRKNLRFRARVDGNYALLDKFKQTTLSFEANFSFFSLADGPPRNLQITAYK